MAEKKENQNIEEKSEAVNARDIELEKNETRIKELETLIDELKDQSVRALAESENTRKRAEKEISDASKYAVTSITKDLIEVIESLYRATNHIDDTAELSDNEKSLIEGIELTKASFLKIMEKNGVKRVDPNIGENFDHNFHQAISQEDSKDVEPGKILKVIQAGYTVNDRLTKPVMVVVSK